MISGKTLTQNLVKSIRLVINFYSYEFLGELMGTPVHKVLEHKLIIDSCQGGE